MAKGFLGNEIPDTAVSVPIEDYQAYAMLIKGRQVIVDTIEREGCISVLEVLSALGGCKALRLYTELMNEYRGEENGEQHNS